MFVDDLLRGLAQRNDKRRQELRGGGGGVTAGHVFEVGVDGKY